MEVFTNLGFAYWEWFWVLRLLIVVVLAFFAVKSFMKEKFKRGAWLSVGAGVALLFLFVFFPGGTPQRTSYVEDDGQRILIENAVDSIKTTEQIQVEAVENTNPTLQMIRENSRKEAEKTAADTSSVDDILERAKKREEANKEVLEAQNQ